MRRLLLRIALWTAYSGALLVITVIAAYFAFTAFVRGGGTTVPELAGLSVEEAGDRLADHGLKGVESGSGRFDAEVAAGHVLKQDPVAGAVLKRGGRVRLVISRGPQQIQVPDLTGRELQAAQVLLAAEDLVAGRVARVFGEEGRPGGVVGQAPAPGTLVGSGQAIDLYVLKQSHDATWVMPDLTYREYEPVRRFFESRGLRFGSVKFEPYEGIPAGTILRQFPLAGHPVELQEVISVVVAARAQSAGQWP